MKVDGFEGSFQQKEVKPGYKYWYRVLYDPTTKKMKIKYWGKTLPRSLVTHEYGIQGGVTHESEP